MVEIIFEFVIQLIGELLAEVIFGKHPKQGSSTPKNVIGFILIILFGFGLGLLSLKFQNLMIKSMQLQILNLIMTPLVIGIIMHRLGRSKECNGKNILTLDRFWNAYIFALMFALARFLMGGFW